MSTSSKKPLTMSRSASSVGTPRLSPDGTRVAWTSWKEGAAEVFAADADGGPPRGHHRLLVPAENRARTPEVVDLGGRCVLPGFTDSHVHFPTWSLSQRDVQLEGLSGLAEALDRIRRHPRHGDWVRGTGWPPPHPDHQPPQDGPHDTPAADYERAGLAKPARA